MFLSNYNPFICWFVYIIVVIGFSAFSLSHENRKAKWNPYPFARFLYIKYNDSFKLEGMRFNV